MKMPIRHSIATVAALASTVGMLRVPAGAQAGSPQTPHRSESSPATQMPKLRRQPGFATGWVSDAKGKPLARAIIKVWALSTNAFGKTLHATVKTGPDGTYRTPIAGNWVYRVEAQAPVEFDDKLFNLPCNPIKTEGVSDVQRSKEGVLQNFVIALTGLKRTDDANPTRPNDYVGAGILLYYAIGDSKPLPKDTVVTLTLVPVSKLADGSTGKTLTFARTVKALDNDALGGLKIENTRSLHDIPLGIYRISASVKLPDREALPMVLSTGQGNSAVSGETIELHFKPQSYSAGTEIPLVALRNPKALPKNE